MTYTITKRTGKDKENIKVDSTTGLVTFKDKPETVTIQATHAHGTSSYTFTITDHFPARNGHSSVMLNGVIYVIGGYFEGSNGRHNFDDVWKSSDDGQTWTEVTKNSRNKFSVRSAHSSVVLNGAIYVIGGSNTANLDNVWKSSDDGETWTDVTKNSLKKFSARFYHSSVALNGAIYVIGGRSKNDVWKSTNSGQTWIEITQNSNAKFSSGHHHNSSVVLNDGSKDAIYVIKDRLPINEVWKSTNGQTWTKVQTQQGKKLFLHHLHSSVVLNGAIYVIGGSRNKQFLNEVWKSTDGGVTWVNVHAATTTP